MVLTIGLHKRSKEGSSILPRRMCILVGRVEPEEFLVPFHSSGSVQPRIYFDVSRLLWRSSFGAPTGIDRVELAYARELVSRYSDRAELVIFSPASGIRCLPQRVARRLVSSSDHYWATGATRSPTGKMILSALSALGPMGARNVSPGGAYLNVSGFPLWHKGHLPYIANRLGLAPFAFIHDAIPLTHSEYVPQKWVERTKTSFGCVNEYAAGIVVNSNYTARTAEKFITRDLPTLVAPLGVSPSTDTAVHLGARPYFVCVGTVEPRKNHITLLHVWRELVEELKDRAPKLKIIGRVGWKCDHILSLIQESPALGNHVELWGWRSDAEVARLVRGARALLAPSFVEGYDLPLAEALSLGTPCICSDIPAHREVAKSAAEFVKPLDASTWLALIKEYAQPNSTLRTDQLGRLAKWTAPRWSDHVDEVVTFISKNAAPQDGRPAAPAQLSGAYA